MMPNAFFVGFASAIRVCVELNAKISLLVSYRPLAVELRILGRLQHIYRGGDDDGSPRSARTAGSSSYSQSWFTL